MLVRKALNLFGFLSAAQARHVTILNAIVCVAHYAKQVTENMDEDTTGLHGK